MDHSLFFHMQITPPIAKRGRHVLILLQNEARNFLLGSKKIYPTGIFRMVGGGVEAGEDKTTAALRELKEETGLTILAKQLQYLSTVTTDITEEFTTQRYQFITYLFFCKVDTQTPQPADDLDAIQEVTSAELQQLIKRYKQLPTDIDPTEGFAWYDYGQLYSAIHQIALEELQRVQST